MFSNFKDYAPELEDHYSNRTIYQMERVFGYTLISSGGQEALKEISAKLKLKPGQKILDIGCGPGGPALHMARQHGCTVHGVDLSPGMITRAKNLLTCEEKMVRDRVSFEAGDILKMEFPENHLDVIHSKCVFLHIEEKDELFSRIMRWLKPGGKLLIHDLIRGNNELSPETLEYYNINHYYLLTFNDYNEALKKAGLRSLESQDMMAKYRQDLEEQVEYLLACKEPFILDYCQKDFDYIMFIFGERLRQIRRGELSMGHFLYTK